MRQLFARNNPEAADLIRAADNGWATLVQMENAGAMLGAKNGLFTPAQFLNAVKRSDHSLRDRTFAHGDALNQDLAAAAKEVLPSSVPDSGTAGRLLLAELPKFLASPHLWPASIAALPYMAPGLNAARQGATASGLRELAMGLVPSAGAVAGSLAASR